MKYKNVFLLSILALSGLLVSLTTPLGVLAAGDCYTETGSFQVEPQKIDCPPAGSQPVVSYHDASGAVITNAPQSGHCYAGITQTQGSFGQTRYHEESCAGLETLLTNAKKAACESSNGVWLNSEAARGFYCDCQNGYTVVDAKCTPVPQSETNTSNGGAALSSDLEFGEDGSKIFDYLQTGVNLLTALAGLAITAAVIIGGIQYSTAGGNPQAAAKAKGRIGNAFIALLCLVFLYGFLQWLVPGGIFN